MLQQRLTRKWQEALDTALARGALGVDDAEPPRLKSIEIPNATAQEMLARLAPEWPIVAKFEDSQLKRLGVMTHSMRVWRSPQCWDSTLPRGDLACPIHRCTPRSFGADCIDSRMPGTRSVRPRCSNGCPSAGAISHGSHTTHTYQPSGASMPRKRDAPLAGSVGCCVAKLRGCWAGDGLGC